MNPKMAVNVTVHHEHHHV